jgi:CARDB
MSLTFKYASYLIGLMILSSCVTLETAEQEKSAAPTQDATRIQLKQPLHFATPDGSDVIVQTGTYRVEQAADIQLRLSSTAGEPPILISAEAMPDTPQVPVPIALGKLFEPDAYNLILLLPGGTGLQSYGSTSGVLSRGFGLKEKIQMIDKRFVLQDVPPQPRPDLVPTCLWYSEQVVAPNFLTFYFVNSGVKNQGTVAAGASQARYASSTLPVPILQPGQVHTLVFPFTNVSPPSSSVNVDSANQVVESNEQNNAGQQRC